MFLHYINLSGYRSLPENNAGTWRSRFLDEWNRGTNLRNGGGGPGCVAGSQPVVQGLPLLKHMVRYPFQVMEQPIDITHVAPIHRVPGHVEIFVRMPLQSSQDGINPGFAANEGLTAVPGRQLNNHRLKSVGLHNGLKVRIPVI